MNYPTLAHFRHFSLFRHSTIITYFQKRSILTNKANFEDGQMIANLITIKVYEENGHSGHQKTNPIQTQLKPKQTQFNPKQTQFKPNSNPTCSELVEPIDEGPKFMQSVYIQRIMKKNVDMGQKKQIQNKPNCKNAAPAERINFLLFFFLNLMAGYADKNV